MILSQKHIKYLLLAICLVYSAFYLLILKSSIIRIQNLVIVEYLSICIYVIALVIAILLMSKNASIAWTVYKVIGIALILFFLFSIFVLKVEDIFFWDIQKSHYEQFFKFSFLVLGWNYLLAIPYAILLIIEGVLLFNFTKQKNIV